MRRQQGRAKWHRNRLREALADAGVSMTRLAEFTGHDLGNVSRFVNHLRPATDTFARQCALILRRPQHELFSELVEGYEPRRQERKPQRYVPARDRFWQFVGKPTESGCREWQGGTSSKSRYGALADGTGRKVYAHHRAYELAYGPIPVGLWVLHRCDNPLCVNPRHLYAGTPSDNAIDRERRGRSNRIIRLGSDNKNAILTDADVLEIRRLHHRVRAKELALRFGVSVNTIYSIQLGYSWKHLLDDQPEAA